MSLLKKYKIKLLPVFLIYDEEPAEYTLELNKKYQPAFLFLFEGIQIYDKQKFKKKKRKNKNCGL